MSQQRSSVRPYDPSASDDDVRAAFRDGDLPVAVYGLGKMGLPLAVVYAGRTGNVVGVDVDEAVVDAVNDGDCPVRGEPMLDEHVADLVDVGALDATTDAAAAARDARIHVVIVPTLIDEDDRADLSAVRAALENVGAGLDPGDLVVVESTVPPRSCRDRFLPLLAEESGLDPGAFGLAFCPERTSSGRALSDIRGAYPKVVGGVDDESTRAAARVYDELVDNEIVAVADATTAEAVKVFEGVYRDVNIALANELGRYADALDVDVTEAIDAANTQPYCELHTPGAGVGGHCIPYYPHFLIGEFDAPSTLMETAREVNESMPRHVADLAIDGLSERDVDPRDARVLVLGMTYRPGVDELRATPAVPVVERLASADVDVVAVDPVASDPSPVERAGAEVRDLDAVARERFDAVVLVTAQPAFEELDVPALGPERAPLVVVDGRQALTHLRDDDRVRYEGVGLRG